MGAGTSAETTIFIRPDGREKVTGAGRYTADSRCAPSVSMDCVKIP